eukprot:TRINITY_DN15084_c0_g3_i1.p1 TRINITY_DN15084_c0_g3~~TRINITY_DN15084_c0_g3_i1.p1  ORF type:complete len:309 (-),score=76.87 TRINITY_DN15084_c0_g3_i1:363-1289(-)
MQQYFLFGFFFFFQAEDGIRDAQESRGLGDVYKRQLFRSPTAAADEAASELAALAQQLQQDGDTYHQAQCLAALARCHQIVCQPNQQADCLTRAARAILEPHEAQPTPEVREQYVEWMASAGQLLHHPPDPTLAASTYDQLAQKLQEWELWEEAMGWYEHAAELYSEGTCFALTCCCLESALQCAVSARAYEAGVVCSHKLCDAASGVTDQMEQQGAVWAVLLTLAMRDKSAAEQALLRLGSLSCRSSHNDQVLSVLQGLVQLGAGWDANGMSMLFDQLTPHLTSGQQQLCLQVEQTAATSREIVLTT